jgi:serine/threonine protein kinase
VPGKVCPQCGEEYELNSRFCPRDGATLTASAENDSLEGQIIAGRYQILRTLGEGAMGQVFLAEHLRMKRKVALKIMRPALATDPDAISRFNREANNASRIDHPNVAAIFDFGDAEGGMIYLAMEYVDGLSLSGVLRESETIPPSRAAGIIHQIADALQAAHDQGIWHRDLKPDNIMLRRAKSGVDIVKLVDFGISKVLKDGTQEVTVTGAVIGTPAYMSPEQVKSESLDGRSDVFSLGLVAFKMLTGSLPFSGVTALECMASRLSEQAFTLREVRHDFDWGTKLEAVMARVLATNREQRYPTAPDFAREFDEAVRGMPDLHAEALRLPLTPRSGNAIIESSRESSVPQGFSRQVRKLAIMVGGVAAVAAGILIVQSKLSPPAPAQDRSLAQQGQPISPVAGAKPFRADSIPTSVSPRASFSLAGPNLLVRVAGLSPSLRKKVAVAVRTMPAVKLVDDVNREANLVIQADSAGTLTVLGPHGEERVARIDTGSIARVLTPMVRRELGIVQLAALETQISRQGLMLQFANNKQTFAKDDEIQFRVRSDQGGYLTLVDLAPDGIVTVLHPSKLLDVGRLAAGKEVLLPGASDAAIRATLPGAGVVRAIITPAPLALKRKGDFATSTDDPALIEHIRNSLERMIARGSTSWSTRSIPYVVR